MRPSVVIEDVSSEAGLASNVTWTLWFSAHHGLLDGDSFDYAAEAAAKWARAERDLSHPELGSLLQPPGRSE